MARTSVSSLLLALAEHAPALRRAGVRSFSIGGLEAELTPLEPDAGPRAPESPSYGDPLSDPETYGASGRVPGFTRELDDLD